MNMQALMKQAQAMQKKMLSEKDKIDQKIFEGNSELVNVKMNGKREVLSINLKVEDKIESDEIEIFQDMIALAINDALKKIDKEIEQKLGNQAGQFGGLF